MATQMQGRPTSTGGRRRLFRFTNTYTRDQKLFLIEAMLLNSANVITGGVFLTGLLVLMGASNLMVGLIMSSGSWSLMLSLAASVIVERVRRKKHLLAGVALVFRLLTALPVFLPAIMGWGMPTALTAAAMIVTGNALFSLYNTGFNIFFMDSIPVEGRTPYIYFRIFWIRIAYTVLSLGMGFLLDALHKSYAGFIVVFSAGLALGIADALVILMIKGPSGAAHEDAPVRPFKWGELARQLVEPLSNRRFVSFLLFTFAFFFCLAMSSAYTSLYQYKYLKLSVGFISVYSTCTYVIMIALTNVWARLEEKIGRLKVVCATALLIAMEFFVYGFLTPKTLALIVLSPIFAGVGSSGFWACVLPYRYDLMPQEGKMVYEGWYGFAFGAANLLGALVGGKLQHLLPDVMLPFMTFTDFQIIYFISGALSILSLAVFWLRARRDCAV